MVSRIKPYLPNIIDQEQFAYVQDRFIGEPIRIIEDILNYTSTNNIPGIIFRADYEAAFDSFDHTFIYCMSPSESLV